MSNKDQLLSEIDRVPESFLAQVLEYIRYLKTNSMDEKKEATLASESSLRKDWMKPEEDRAWQGL